MEDEWWSVASGGDKLHRLSVGRKDLAARASQSRRLRLFKFGIRVDLLPAFYSPA